MKYGLKAFWVPIVVGATRAHAVGTIGTGDTFLATFANWAIGLAFFGGVLGLLGWYVSSNDYGQTMLSGSLSFLSRSVMAGSIVTILTALGLTQGAVL